MTETRSLLRAQSIGLTAISRPLRMPWTARSGPSGTESPRSAVRRNASSKSSQRRSTAGRRQPGVSGVADSLVNPGAKAQAARANSVRLGLALVLCGGTLTSRPPRSRHASLRWTGHRRNRSAPLRLSNSSGFRRTPHHSIRVDDDGHRAVVHQRNFHIRGEQAGLHGHVPLAREDLVEA